MMKAILVADDERHSLGWAEAASPSLGPRQVLVRVRAAGVNRADLLQRAGHYPPPPGASQLLGLEVAGEVAALGEGVADWQLRQRVCALVPGGGYAELVACDADVLLPMPAALSFEEAAALPEALYTAYLNLVIEGGLQAGQRVLIHAGASGIGTVAIQLCRCLGSPVYATASASKLAALRELGAELTIDRHGEDFAQKVREATKGGAVDLILDPVGGSYLARNIELLAPGGRLVLIGLLGGAAAELALGKMLSKGLRLIGSTLRNRSLEEKAAITEQLKQRIWPLVGKGELKPVIHATFPITEAAAAHDLMRSNSTIGKLMLTIP